MKRLLILILLSTKLIAGEGPGPVKVGPMNKVNDVPPGYKLEKIEAVCTTPEPCENEKKLIEKLKQELDFIKARNRLIENENKLLRNVSKKPVDCPEPKVKYVDVHQEVIKEKIVTKEVIKQVPADRNISFGLIGAYSQDGVSTTTSKLDEDAVDAYTYRSFIAGPYIMIPIADRYEIGAFGMFGGVNQTIGAKIGMNFK